MKKIILHIGKHKTATSSFQHCLLNGEKDLNRNGIYYLPRWLSHQIAAVSIRENLPIPPLISLQSKGQIISLEDVAQSVSEFLKNKKYNTLIISNEHFSYFRKSTEINRLRKILPAVDSSSFSIFLVTREREDFRISYRDQIIKSGHRPSSNVSSPYYCRKDSWLLDDASIIDLWTKEFENVTVLKYCREDMVSKLLISMQLSEIVLTKEYRMNKADISIKRFMRLILRKTPFYDISATAWKTGKAFWLKFNQILLKK